MAQQPIKQNLLDKAISFFNPKAGAERMRFKIAANLMEQTYRKYDGASVSRRTSGRLATGASATSEINTALSTLRNRSRELARNNPYAENAIRELSNNMVGTGIMPKPVGLPKTTDKKLKQLWKDWADSTNADYDGHLNYYGIQQLAARTVVESGEVLIRKHIIADSKYFPLQLQLLEPDFIDSTKYATGLIDGGYILYGVEFNKNNKVVAYWLWDHHPGDSMRFATKSNRIPAEELIHIFEKKRPGQFRGVPFGHASMLRLMDFDDYEDAQLIRQKIAACFTVFVTDNDQSGTINATNTDAMLEKVEPGIIEHLPAGKQVTFANPPDAGANYDGYTKTVLRGVASGYGMDYVTLTGDLTAVNFSSGRMGWLKFHRNITSWQWNMLIPQMCNKSWVWFIELANVIGVVKQMTVPVSWTPPRREMIDPVKEVKGIESSIRAGLQSLPAAIREMGDDPDETMAELVETAKQLDSNGLKLTTDPRFDATRKMEADLPPDTNTD